MSDIPFDGDEDEELCPTCKCLGLIPNYETNYDETCRTCDGTGLVFVFGITINTNDVESEPLFGSFLAHQKLNDGNERQ